MTIHQVYIWLLLFALSCSDPKEKKNLSDENQLSNKQVRAKFEPPDGQCILFVGQELTAIGGLVDYSSGYFDHFRTPGGFTMYTNLSPGDTSFGHLMAGLDGVYSTDDWGDTPSNMSLQLADDDFKNCALAIGLSFVNHEVEVANGLQDTLVDHLGDFIQSLAARPVFLRIGYEFGGAWNHYDRLNYIRSFKRIRDRFESQGIDNIAYVWQSHGWGMDQAELELWYPGDHYVDWCGYSFFSRFEEVQMLEFARKRNKPVFIAEASPTISTSTVKINGKTKETILSNPDQADEAWEKWFTPFFQTIEENEALIKAVSYINCHWKAAPMWRDNPTFQNVDARLQTNKEIAQRWKEKVYRDRFLHASDSLFNLLWHK